MKKTIAFLQELGSKDSDVAVCFILPVELTLKVFDFFRLNVLGRATQQNVPQLEVGCPPSPADKFTPCENTSSLSHYFMEHGYVTAKSASHTVRVNHESYAPE